MSTHQQVVERYWRAAADGDFDAVGELFTDDVVVEWPQSGERVRGKEACLNIFRSYPGGSPRFHELRRTMSGDELFIAEATVDYPDGKSYVQVGVFEFQGDKIAHEIDYFAEMIPAPEWRRQWVEVA